MYPLIYSMIVDRVLLGIRIDVAEFSGMKPGDRVLDVCCGTGAQAILYGRMGIISWGIDLDPHMIKFAEKRRARLRLANTFFQRGSATALPFKAASFDHASISMGLHEKEASSRDRIISEMRRVVKKDGAVVIIDYRVPYPQDAYGYATKAVERMAGKAHFRHFEDFLKDGGVDSLLRRHHLHEQERDYPRRMPLLLLKVRNV